MHTCHALNCDLPTKAEMLMCFPHWKLVPTPLKDRIWEHYRKGQCDDWKPSQEYCEAARAAILAVAAKEGITVSGTEQKLRLYDFFAPESPAAVAPQQFAISLFTGKSDNKPKPAVRTWAQLCERFDAPVTRAEKDGPLFSPATFSEPRRLKQHVTELSLLVLDCDHAVPDIDTLIRTLCNALLRSNQTPSFAIYSTHSHRIKTESNPDAEPRYRIVIPLAIPIPVDKFLDLWNWLADIEGLHVDQSAKDPSRIYYTPARSSRHAPYEVYIEDGGLLDWKQILKNDSPTLPPASAEQAALRSAAHTPASGGAGRRTSAPPALPKSSDINTSHEARHAELGNRIRSVAKRNSRGNYDMRCPAHKGKGTSSLGYFPKSEGEPVYCNAGCDYYAILAAFGLPNHVIGSTSQLASATAPLGTTAAVSPSIPAGSAGSPSVIVPPLISSARLHVIYSLTLAHLFELTPEDEEKVCKQWGVDSVRSEDIEWPGTDDKAPVKVCSFPSQRMQLQAVKRLSEHFNLEGVPGFYRVLDLPGPEGAQRRGQTAEFGPWRFALGQLQMRPGALLSPYDNGSGFILGIRIHRSVKDASAFLLTSRGLPGGGAAVGHRKEVAA